MGFYSPPHPTPALSGPTPQKALFYVCPSLSLENISYSKSYGKDVLKLWRALVHYGKMFRLLWILHSLIYHVSGVEWAALNIARLSWKLASK